MTEVVAALIWDKKKFLICQRPAHKARGLLWEFVGGKVEPGETREQALIRECREELAVTLSVGEVFMEVVHEYPDLTVHLTLFHAAIAEGVPVMVEHNDIRWITPSEIPQYDFCPADGEILAKIQESEGEGKEPNPFGETGRKRINTDRLQIRELQIDDWQALREIALDFRKSEYAIYDMPLPIEENEIKPLCETFARSGLWYAVCLAENMIGYICFHEENGSYDLGYCFHFDYQGKGYAYEACTAMLEYISKTRNVTSFTAGTALKNIPSCKLLHKLGFVLNGTEMLSFHQDEKGNDITFEGGNFMLV